jgi:hypothetical protein
VRESSALAAFNQQCFTRSVPALEDASLLDVQAFRELLSVEAAREPTLCAAAQRFATLFVARFPSIVLSRVFAVVPYKRLPVADAECALRFAEQCGAAAILVPTTPVLSLLGSTGAYPAWNDRRLSKGHLSIPLLSQELVEGIPMIAQLLADLGVDLAYLDGAREIGSRRLLGSTNQCFYVEKASESRDSRGRHIIPSQAFVAEHHIQTVFGMAGSYVDGTMVASISFTAETVKKSTVDRFVSVIANFKMATTSLLLNGRLYDYA